MNSTARPVPVNTVDRTAFRDMCAHFARREIAPRWQEADRTRTFPREFLVAAARAGQLGNTRPTQSWVPGSRLRRAPE